MAQDRMMLRKSIALAVTLAVLTAVCFGPAQFRMDARFWGHVFDAGHIPMWAWLAAVLLYALPARVQSMARRYLLAFTLAIAIAFGVELLQPLFGRARTLGDAINGTMGAGLALTGIAAWRRSGNWLWRCGHALALVGTLTVALWPAYEELRGIRWRQANFPSLGNFEEGAELKLWRPQGGSRSQPSSVQITRARAANGEQSLRVAGGAGDWAGVSYEAGGKDWSPFRALAMDVFNPRGPFKLFVRVDEESTAPQPGRLERGFTLNPGWNRIRLPLTDAQSGPQAGRLSLKRIRRVAVFTGDGEAQRFWFLDNVHLEKKEDGD